MILDECDGTIVRTSLLSPRGDQVISRAAGEVTGEFSCWSGILPFLQFKFCAFCIAFADVQTHGTDGQVPTILFCMSYLLLCRIAA